MWRPGFAHGEVLNAYLRGYHRSLCVYSWVHRGTRERPGLVLGLDRGGSCRGRAFAIAAEREAEVLCSLDARELVTDVYRRKRLKVVTPRGRLPAWCYVVRRDHPQYAGRLESQSVLELVRTGVGQSGHCRDYLVSTVSHLEELGILDRSLDALAREIELFR
jgi:glutathione-specific gamma-glutamylcyclotransferase